MKITVLLFTILVSTSAWAQQTQALAQFHLSGKVVNDQNQPVELATVHLKDQIGQTVQNIFSDEDGAFQFQALTTGVYQVLVSRIGYLTTESDLIEIKKSTALPAIVIRPDITELEAVTVTAQRPLVERRPDMMVVNVENSSLSAGNSALEILERSPGIIIDKDDNISLMGKQGVLVTINGKQTNLSSEQLANYLRNLDGNTIKSVELITNPSSKYEAAGSSGIINIVLKKNMRAGTNGNVTVSAGYGLRHKSNTSVNISHRTDKVNLYGTVSYLNNGGEQVLNLDRTVQNGGINTAFAQSTMFDRLNQNFSYQTGVDYHTSARNTLTLEVNGYANGNTNDNNSTTFIGQSFQSTDSTLISLANSRGTFQSFGANLNNQFDIDSNGRKLTVQADISQFFRKNETAYNNTFTLPSGDLMKQPELSNSITPTTIDIRMAKLDYTHPFGGRGRLETGMRYSQVRSDNEMQFDIQRGGQWQNDQNRSNQFIYDEHISAAYATYQQQFGKFGLQAGLRTEYTVSTGHSITLNSQVKRDYLDLFPTLFLSYAPSDAHHTGISYSKRINRPNYNLMNPFSYFLDQYTSERGNPYLQPEYAHVFEATYSYKSRYHLSLGYNVTEDAIVESMVQDDESKTTYVTRDNLARQTTAYANLSIPVKITSYWSTTTNLNPFYLGFKGQLSENSLDQGQYAFHLRHSNEFKILPTLTAELSVNYHSPLAYSIYKIGEQWAIDMGLSKSVLQKRGSLKLSVSDVLRTRQHKVWTNHANLDVFVDQRNESRIARLTFSYSFGSTNGGRRDSRIEEKSRVGNL